MEGESVSDRRVANLANDVEYLVAGLDLGDELQLMTLPVLHEQLYVTSYSWLALDSPAQLVDVSEREVEFDDSLTNEGYSVVGEHYLDLSKVVAGDKDTVLSN